MGLNALRSTEVLPPLPTTPPLVYGSLSLVDWLHAHTLHKKQRVQVEHSYITGDVNKV